jgi:serine phosphatase RsbU (regulator of sigma subunit)
MPSEYINRKNDVTFHVALVFFSICAPYYFLFHYFNLTISKLFVIPTASIFLISIILNRVGWHFCSKIILITATSLSLFFYGNILGSDAGAQLLLFSLIALPPLFFDVEQRCLIGVSLSIPILTYFMLEFGHYDWIPYKEIVDTSSLFYIRCIAILTTFLLLILSLAVYVISNKRYETKQVKLIEELEVSKIKTDKELKLAGKVQAEILPPKAPIYPNYHIDHAFLPAGELSGDYYDYIWLSPTRLAIVVADIVGKGLPASLMMVGFKEIFHHHLNPNDSPAVAMAKLNNIVCQKQIMSKYVPVIYAIIDFEANTFTYTNAGHEPGKLFTKGVIKDLNIGGTPLGMMEDEHYDEETHVLNPGDRAILYTDGLTDMRNQDGEQLGIENVLGWMENLLNEPSADFVPQLIDKGREFFKNTSQADDITLVTVKRV